MNEPVENMKNKKTTVFFLIGFFVALLYLLPHIVLEIKHEDYSPFYGKDSDIMVIDDTWAYGSRAQTYYKTGSWISDSAIYENQNKKFAIEISPQIIISILHLAFSFDAIYYISVLFSITISLAISMFFLDKLFNNVLYSFISSYSFFFLSSIFEWMPALVPTMDKFYGIGYSPLLKFYNYSFYFAPLLSMYFFYYLSLRTDKNRYMILSSIFFLISIFSGAFRTIYTLLSLGFISFYLFTFKKNLRRTLIYQSIIYAIPFILFILYVILTIDKNVMGIYKNKIGVYVGHLTLFNFTSLQYFIVFTLLFLLVYLINRKFIFEKLDYILIIWILFLTGFLMSNVNLIFGSVPQPDRIIVIFMIPFLAILAILFIFLTLSRLCINYHKITLISLSILILLIGTIHYYDFIFNRNYADKNTKDLIAFLKEVEPNSVILTIDPFLMGYIQFFTNNFIYIPNGFTSASDDHELGSRLGNAFRIYNFSEERVKFYTERRNIEDLDDEYKSFWTFVVHHQNRVNIYHPDKEEAMHSIKELEKINRSRDIVRYYKIPTIMYEAIYYQYNKPKKLGYKLDYVIVGPKEGEIVIPDSTPVYSNSEYTVYHLDT